MGRYEPNLQVIACKVEPFHRPHVKESVLTLRGELRVEVVVLAGIVNISSMRQAGEVGVVLAFLVSLV